MSRKPADTRFKQQRMTAWQPVLTPNTVIPTFFLVGLLFIPIGFVVLSASSGVKESQHVRYDDECAPPCTQLIPIEVNARMAAPVYMYYQLTNFYQNHRRYVKSRSDEQLAGKNPNRKTVLDCEPLRSEDDPTDNNNNLLYHPCGLVANSWFNDSIVLLDSGLSPVTQTVDGIAWPSDRKEKFKPVSDAKYVEEGYLPPKNIPNWNPANVSNEEFIVWMRTAGLSKFRKLYRIIDQDLEAGTYMLQIDNNFPVASFKGTKHIILSTTSWLGGKNDFLGIAYVVTGFFCIILGLIFLIKHKSWHRQLGTPILS